MLNSDSLTEMCGKTGKTREIIDKTFKKLKNNGFISFFVIIIVLKLII